MKFAKYLLTTCAVLASQQAFAQDDASASEEGGDIVVTGQYIVEDRIDTATGLGLTTRETPQSVSIITEQRILDQNLVSAADVLVNSVGVWSTSSAMSVTSSTRAVLRSRTSRWTACRSHGPSPAARAKPISTFRSMSG